MAKGSFYRRYRRSYYPRYRSISNYFNCKLNVPMIGTYAPGGGNETFGFRSGDLALSTQYSTAVLIQVSPMWQQYSGMFSMFRLRGIAVKAKAVGENNRFQGPIIFKLGFVKQGAGYDWRLVSEANYQMTLPFVGDSKMFVPMLSQGVGWIKTSNVITDQPGQFMIAKYPDGEVGDITLFWDLEFVFYITYKLSIY